MKALALLAAVLVASTGRVASAAPAKGHADPAAQAAALAKEQDQLKDSMTHWALLCRSDSVDPQMQDLNRRLGELRARADQKLDKAQYGILVNDFDAWQDDLSKLLAASSGSSLPPEEFKAKLHDSVAGLAKIGESRHVTQADLKKVNGQIKFLRQAVGPVAANYYFDRARGGGSVGVIAAARAQGSEGTARFFRNYHFAGYTGSPRILRPDQSGPVPLRDVNEQPQSASGWSLKGVISSVSSTARRYAGKVADSIVNFSRKYGVDERLQTAFLWVESQFDPHAKSGAGAMGLGQLMPDTARGLGIRNPYDIDQNVRGSASYIKALLGQFSSPNEIRYTQGLYAFGKTRVARGEDPNKVWQDIFQKTPLGVKNAIAAYNAGSGAITYYAHGNYLNLPRRRTARAQANGEGYWQTVNYVPAVLHRYFDIYLKTPTERGGPAIFSV